ncbi:MAG: oligosaccharide flippase family protein [Acidaminococcus intestini]
MSRLLGGEGIGLYQLAYPLYNLLVGIVAAGIPAAMSLIVARYAAQKEWGSVRRVVTVSFPFLVFLGLAVSLAAYGLIPCLFSAGLIKDERAFVPMLFCVPALFLTVPLAGLRGYFQGFQEMRPTALSQILEQFFRVAFMLVLSVWLLPKGLAMAAGGAILEQLRGP